MSKSNQFEDGVLELKTQCFRGFQPRVHELYEGGIPMAGRKPKPTALKKLEGNPGKRKLNNYNNYIKKKIY